MDNGGPAFPLYCGPGDMHNNAGLSLRDYFAIHVDQPGVTEIVTAAGLTQNSAGLVVCEDDTPRPFNVWWQLQGPEYRAALYAKVRYQLADAMLAARKESANG